MKTSSCLIAIIALAGMILMGCERPNPNSIVSPRSDQNNVASLAKSPPANSGPIVVRFTTSAGLVFQDLARQLVSVHSTEDGFFCGPSTVFELLTIQLILNPADPVHLLAKGEPFVKVYGPADLDDFFGVSGAFTGPCDFIANGPKLAEGTAKFLDTDNNFFVVPPGANAFGARSNGTLQLVGGGGKVNFNLKQQFLIKPDGSFQVLVGNIMLTP